MNKEKDNFSEIIKGKLDNYTLPVDDNSWNKIDERLNATPQRKIGWGWVSSIAVAASIALLIIFLFPTNKTTYHHETASVLPSHEKTISQNVPEKEITQPVLFSQNGSHSTAIKKIQSENRQAENNLAFEREVIADKEIVEENPKTKAEEENNEPENRPKKPITYFDFSKEETLPVIKRKKRQSIGLSLGSGGNLLANNATLSNRKQMNIPSMEYFKMETSFFRVAQENVVSKAKDILAKENFPKVNRHLPLSFGVTVQKELDSRFSVESGLVYSFIRTEFSKDTPKTKADLQLHYIGIPLNLHTSVYANRSSKWRVYLSTGGMVEKGILLHFVQKEYYDNWIASITSDEKIDGLQWSVGISPGVDYRINKNYSIYFEPKVSYYFENDQPPSARTEHPVVVGINAGLRYTW